MQGLRLPLSAEATARLVRAVPASARPRRRDTDWRQQPQALRAPCVAARLGRSANAWLAIKGCNQAFWRDDLLAVNGWDESLRGGGPEDKELGARGLDAHLPQAAGAGRVV